MRQSLIEDLIANGVDIINGGLGTAWGSLI